MDTLPDIKVMGVSVFDPVWARRLHSDTNAELLCVVRGEMILELADRRRRLTVGDVALVPPNVPHRDVFPEHDEPEVFLAQFRWGAQEAFFRAVRDERLAALAAHERAEVRRLILALRDQAVSDAELEKTLARSLLHTLLLRLWRAAGSEASGGHEQAAGGDRKHDLMLRARHYLDLHYRDEVSLEGMAERLDVSPYYLSRVFTRESGFSMVSYLTSVRMSKARELLRARTGNVSEVAYAVGYQSGAYFSRVFKRHFGMAPSRVAPDLSAARR